jgi:hypothetical protein
MPQRRLPSKIPSSRSDSLISTGLGSIAVRDQLSLRDVLHSMALPIKLRTHRQERVTAHELGPNLIRLMWATCGSRRSRIVAPAETARLLDMFVWLIRTPLNPEHPLTA